MHFQLVYVRTNKNQEHFIQLDKLAAVVIRSIKRNRFKFCGRFKKRRCMMHVEKNSASRHRATLKKTHYLCEVKLNE